MMNWRPRRLHQRNASAIAGGAISGLAEGESGGSTATRRVPLQVGADRLGLESEAAADDARGRREAPPGPRTARLDAAPETNRQPPSPETAKTAPDRAAREFDETWSRGDGWPSRPHAVRYRGAETAWVPRENIEPRMIPSYLRLLEGLKPFDFSPSMAPTRGCPGALTSRRPSAHQADEILPYHRSTR